MSKLHAERNVWDARLTGVNTTPMMHRAIDNIGISTPNLNIGVHFLWQGMIQSQHSPCMSSARSAFT